MVDKDIRIGGVGKQGYNYSWLEVVDKDIRIGGVGRQGYTYKRSR